MLIDAGQIMGCVLLAEDGELGRSRDFLVDDRAWRVRYLVAETGIWLRGRQVLLPPAKVKEPDFSGRRLPLALTKEQIKSSPPFDDRAPLSRQYEILWSDYYGVSRYWLDEDKKGVTENPNAVLVSWRGDERAGRSAREDRHLFSVARMTGGTIAAADGDMGHLADFLVELRGWKVRYAIVDTRDWLPGKQVCVSITCVEWVDPSSNRAAIGLSKERIRNSPEYNPLVPMSEAYQVVLHDYYGWPKYWEND